MDAPVSRLGPLAGKKVFGTMGACGGMCTDVGIKYRDRRARRRIRSITIL